MLETPRPAYPTFLLCPSHLYSRPRRSDVECPSLLSRSHLLAPAPSIRHSLSSARRSLCSIPSPPSATSTSSRRVALCQLGGRASILARMERWIQGSALMLLTL